MKTQALLRFSFVSLVLAAMHAFGQQSVFNVRDFGATGKKSGNAQPFLQRAIDSCASLGGGMVYLPPGEYSSGTLHLRSHVRFYIEAGATLYSIKVKEAFDKDALLYGEDLENITIEGRGTIDGQGAYEWRLNDIQDDFIRPNQDQMEALGKPLMRSFPKKDQFGKLILLLRCKDVRIKDLSLVRSPSWTIHPYACERLVIDGVYIWSSLAEGVWADGIDPDGCKDVRISNCTIETGDDAIVFYSMNWFGPALPCENITVTNCRLSSASSAIKFCDGNMNCVRNVTIDNCTITNSNRGIAFMVFDGGYVSDVVLSNLTIECRRHDWFWWGDGDPFHFNIKRRSEVHKHVKFENEPPAGSIRNVLIQNVIAHGNGSSVINGHPQSWLDGVTFENVKLYLSSDSTVAYDKAVHALKFQMAKNLKLRNVEVFWGNPGSTQWRSALYVEDAKGLEIESFGGRQATLGSDVPALVLNRVDGAVIRDSRVQEGTSNYLSILGKESANILLTGNDFRNAAGAFVPGKEVQKNCVILFNNISGAR
ncbi:MAG: glycosyl hydrolase family 28 protein [Ignavibacteria bacterium]|nr:glycosyl hydrolase family 28 protein [Ignavibacteria bacterium]